jgi:hypothetical protein
MPYCRYIHHNFFAAYGQNSISNRISFYIATRMSDKKAASKESRGKKKKEKTSINICRLDTITTASNENKLLIIQSYALGERIIHLFFIKIFDLHLLSLLLFVGISPISGAISLYVLYIIMVHISISSIHLV